MKFIPLLFLLLSVLTNASDEQQINDSHTFFKTSVKEGKEDEKLFIHVWKTKEADDFYNLNIEPGCILLKAKITAATESTCTLKITGSYGEQILIESAKKKLGIQTEDFIIKFHKQENKIDGKILSTSNIIQSIQDAETKSTVKPE